MSSHPFGWPTGARRAPESCLRECLVALGAAHSRIPIVIACLLAAASRQRSAAAPTSRKTPIINITAHVCPPTLRQGPHLHTMSTPRTACCTHTILPRNGRGRHASMHAPAAWRRIHTTHGTAPRSHATAGCRRVARDALRGVWGAGEAGRATQRARQPFRSATRAGRMMPRPMPGHPQGSLVGAGGGRDGGRRRRRRRDVVEGLRVGRWPVGAAAAEQEEVGRGDVVVSLRGKRGVDGFGWEPHLNQLLSRGVVHLQPRSAG